MSPSAKIIAGDLPHEALWVLMTFGSATSNFEYLLHTSQRFDEGGGVPQSAHDAAYGIETHLKECIERTTKLLKFLESLQW